MNRYDLESMYGFEVVEAYDCMLDECYDEVVLPYGGRIPMSQVLWDCDPVAYRIGLSEFADEYESEEE